VINAQFNAATEKLAASAPELANVVNKNLIQTEKINNNRNNFVVMKPIIQQANDLWAEDEDDDDDDYPKPQTIPAKSVNSSSGNAQKVR
jgi:hypothetical protein